MSPTGGRHGRLVTHLATELELFARETGRGWVLSGEVGIYTRREPDTVRGADVAFLSKSRSPNEPSEGFLETPPGLVIEVLSPSDRMPEPSDKLSDYFSAGVEQVWVVRPEDRCVQVWTSLDARREYAAEDRIDGEDVLAGFSLAVGDLFGA